MKNKPRSSRGGSRSQRSGGSERRGRSESAGSRDRDTQGKGRGRFEKRGGPSRPKFRRRRDPDFEGIKLDTPDSKPKRPSRFSRDVDEGSSKRRYSRSKGSAPRSPVALRKKSDEVRLQKFLAECGLGSRRKMEKLIVEGRVQVNGKVTNELGAKINPFQDRVEVNRKPVHMVPKGVMLLNKPRGVVSTLSDPEGRPTVADFITKHYRSYFPIGRLDWDSTGLMILTNDGELAELLMHPRYQFDRVYHARVEGSVSDELLTKLEKGVKLRDGMARGVARVVEHNDATTWVEVRVREGRNRLVRRMFDEIGHPVVKLKRVEYGPFKLGKLDVGQVRQLTEKEYALARRKVFEELSAPKSDLNAASLNRERDDKKRAKKRVRTRLS